MTKKQVKVKNVCEICGEPLIILSGVDLKAHLSCMAIKKASTENEFDLNDIKLTP